MKQSCYILIVSVLLVVASTHAQTPLPHAEMGFGQPSHDWQGKTFGAIIPASTVKRIVRIGEMSVVDNRELSTGDFDSVIHYLYDSKLVAAPKYIGQNEITIARLALFTTDGRVFLLELVSKGGSSAPSGLLLDDPSQSARINIADFRFSRTSR